MKYSFIFFGLFFLSHTTTALPIAQHLNNVFSNTDGHLIHPHYDYEFWSRNLEEDASDMDDVLADSDTFDDIFYEQDNPFENTAQVLPSFPQESHNARLNGDIPPLLSYILFRDFQPSSSTRGVIG